MPKAEFIDGNETGGEILYKLVPLEKIAAWLLEMARVGEDVYVCHRRDVGETMPVDYWYIDLSEAQLLQIGGKLLEDGGSA